MNNEKREMTVSLLPEMFTGRNLDHYWLKIQEKIEQEFTGQRIDVEWKNIVIGYIYNRETKHMSITEAQSEIDTLYPWKKQTITHEEFFNKIGDDRWYLEMRDLDEIAFRIMGKPFHKLDFGSIIQLEEYIPPNLQDYWDNICAEMQK